MSTRKRPLPTFTSPPPSPPAPGVNDNDDDNDDEDEDDYMAFVPADAPAAAPHSLTARLREKQRRIETLGRPKSKAELAAEAERKREEALSKSLLDDAGTKQQSKGLKMMKMMGYTPGSSLGRSVKKVRVESEQEAEERRRLEPIAVTVKTGRAGIGMEDQQRRRIKEAAERARRDERERVDYRERVAAERDEKRREALLLGAQKVAERLDMRADFGVEEEQQGGERRVPLRMINVVWRGHVRERERREEERVMRAKMLAGIDEEDEEEQRKALGLAPKGRRGLLDVEADQDEDEEDEELDEFDSLPAGERLDIAVGYLREKHSYCFWCKHQYEDERMDGCPGVDEDSHG